jgi:hypothetical protein
MGVANTRDREITLRILAWWAANDSLRTIGDIRPTRHVAPALIRNLVRLVQLLDGERPTHRLLAADARRQMGHFAAVRATLGSPLMFGSPSLAHAAESIALLADHEIASPRRLRPTATRWHRLVAYPVTQFRIA